MDRLYIVIPAYNESENITEVIRSWHNIVSSVNADSRLVVIDDGSKDNTYEIMTELKAECPQLIPLVKANQGHGATVLYGYRYAIKAGADYVFQTDSDGQTVPEEFWQLWDQREKAGLLAGHRHRREDGWQRFIVTKVLQFIVFCCFRVWITDANVPFRLMRADELKQIMKQIPPNYHLANVMVSVLYKKQKKHVQFFPITFHQRQGGENSINMKKIMVIGRKSISEFLRLKKKC